MTIEEIKELIRVVQDTGIAELEVQRGDSKVRVRNANTSTHEVVLPSTPPLEQSAGQSGSHSISAPEFRQQPPPATSPGEPRADDRDAVVKSPIVGTYYDAPTPGSDPFVKVGDHVHPKQVICIIESMKLMNEIEAEVAGIVVAKLVENGRPVEYGESLLTIRPI